MKLPLIGSRPHLEARVREALQGCHHPIPEILPLRTYQQAEDHLKLEMPELIAVNFPDPDLGPDALLDVVRQDPWLIPAGILALCNDEESTERLEAARGLNMVAVLSPEAVEPQLPRVLDIIHGNRRILFQRNLESMLVQDIAGHFRLDNNRLEAHCHANLISNFLYNTNRIDSATKVAVSTAIAELLINAIEHGNCGITYDEKSAWLSRHSSMEGLLAGKRQDSVVVKKKVTLEYTLTPTGSSFRIEDEGEGFDWRTRTTSGARDLLKPHGRGILMARAVTDQLVYNEKGNEVRFDVIHRTDCATVTPALVKNMKRREIQTSEVLFNEGQPSDFMYFIVKGRYDVMVEGKTVGTLSPDDVFVGEMSFLTKSPRSATVRATRDGLLIEISKKDFVDAVKCYPHYALFLSRLLAQRIQRSNLLSVANQS